MKTILAFLKREVLSFLLILVSLILLILCGGILDTLMVYLSVGFEEEKVALPVLSQWLANWLAGHRGLAIEIMMCFWIFMIIGFVFSAVTARDHTAFRIRFLYLFVLAWILALSVAFVILLGCVLPFDLMLARINGGDAPFYWVRIFLGLELAFLIIAPSAIYFIKKKNSKLQP